jgi:hypothetical protein
MRNPEIGFNPHEQYKPHDPETIVDHIDEISLTPERAKKIAPTELEQFRRELLQQPEYRDYTQAKIKLETFDQIIELLQEKAADTNEDEAVDLKSVEKLSTAIKRDIYDYYSIISTTERYKRLNRFRMDPQDLAQALNEKDKQRRNIHNSMLANLVAFTRNANLLARKLGFEIPNSMLFQDYELDNRSLIGEWAFNQERGRRIELAVAAEEAALQEKNSDTHSTAA